MGGSRGCTPQLPPPDMMAVLLHCKARLLPAVPPSPHRRPFFCPCPCTDPQPSMKEPHNTWSNTNELQQYQVHRSHSSDTITTPSNLPPVLMASNPLVNNKDKQSGISTASWFPNFLYFFKEALAMQHSIQLYCKCPKQGCSKPKNVAPFSFTRWKQMQKHLHEQHLYHFLSTSPD